jgi:hypothetical protein
MRWSRFSVVTFAIISTIVFCVMIAFMKNADALIVMRAFQVTSSFAVAIRFWPGARIAWRENFRTPSQVYAFSMELLSLALGLNAIWLWLWRSADEPRWVVDSWVNGYLVLITYLAHSGKLVAPGLKDGVPERESYWFIGWTVLIGTILAIFGLFDFGFATKVLSILEPIARESAIWDPTAILPEWTR